MNIRKNRIHLNFNKTEMRNFFILFVFNFIILLIFFFTGCGKGENQNNFQTTKSNNNKEVEKVDEKKSESNIEGGIKLQLVKIENPWSSIGLHTKIDFELTNNLGKHIDEYTFDVSLRDINGEYLAGNKRVYFKNVRNSRKDVADTFWENTNPTEVGEVKIKVMYFTADGIEYNNGDEITIIMKNKYNLKVNF